jgi:hypothetical protein
MDPRRRGDDEGGVDQGFPRVQVGKWPPLLPLSRLSAITVPGGDRRAAPGDDVARFVQPDRRIPDTPRHAAAAQDWVKFLPCRQQGDTAVGHRPLRSAVAYQVPEAPFSAIFSNLRLGNDR